MPFFFDFFWGFLFVCLLFVWIFFWSGRGVYGDCSDLFVGLTLTLRVFVHVFSLAVGVCLMRVNTLSGGCLLGVSSVGCRFPRPV